MKFSLLLLFTSFLAITCYSQGHVVVQDRKGTVYVTDIENQTTDTIERAYAGRLVGGSGIASNTVRVFYQEKDDTTSKDYSLAFGRLHQRKQAFFLSKRGAESNTYTCAHDPAYTVRCNVLNGDVYIYKNGDLLSSFKPDYKGLVPSYVTYTPTDIDMPSGTMLMEEELAPITAALGKPRTSVREVAFMYGEKLWSQSNASGAFYSPAKDFINFASGDRSAGKAASAERKSKKVKYYPAKRGISFWL